MTEWTRQELRDVGTLAYQVGMTPKEARQAVMIGARVQARGLIWDDLTEALQLLNEKWAEEERQATTKYVPVSTLRRIQERFERRGR